jgi:chromate reductase
MFHVVTTNSVTLPRYWRHHGRRHHGRILSILVCCRSLSSSSALHIAVITGSTRTEGPPRPILGPRVSEFIIRGLKRRGNQVTLLDPMELDLPLLQKPHFCYSPSQVPAQLENISKVLLSADGYVCITPEYNHAPSPALLNLLNHFGSSTFSFKPSAIVTYSAGQWGGTRAAMGLRPVLSELGCLPVSAMIHIPRAHKVLEEDGSVQVAVVDAGEEEEDQWEAYCDRCFSQLEWWATAANNHRGQVDPFKTSPSLEKTPSQRNAPG